MGKDFLKSNSELKSGHLEFAVSHPYRDEYPLRKASSYQSGRESVFWTESESSIWTKNNDLRQVVMVYGYNKRLGIPISIFDCALIIQEIRATGNLLDSANAQ